MSCRDRHAATDAGLGQPLCLDCYDHAGHVVWNHEAPELWRRTIQQVDRELRRLGRALGVDLRRRYMKVYEFQVRGVIHYHALIRLDGVQPRLPRSHRPAPGRSDPPALEDAVRTAFTKTRHTSASHPANGGRGWPIAWGTQLDVKHVNAPGGEVNLAQVTGYLAKYVTKDTEVTGLSLRRIHEVDLDHIDPDTHTGRLIHACWKLGAHEPLRPATPLGPPIRLRRPHHHEVPAGSPSPSASCASNARSGAAPRATPTCGRHTSRTRHLQLGYQATGWRTTGDALLANTAAALAREYADTSREHHADNDTPLNLPTAA